MGADDEVLGVLEALERAEQVEREANPAADIEGDDDESEPDGD